MPPQMINGRPLTMVIVLLFDQLVEMISVLVSLRFRHRCWAIFEPTGANGTVGSYTSLSVCLSVWVYPGHIIHHYNGIWATVAIFSLNFPKIRVYPLPPLSLTDYRWQHIDQMCSAILCLFPPYGIPTEIVRKVFGIPWKKCSPN